MRTSNVITIKAPLHVIYMTASDLARWPDFLPHYRYNRFLSPMPWGGIVKMSAVRTFIPTTWISEYRIDTEKCQLYFKHLKSALNATRGMVVVWSFTETPEGIRVEITHDLDLHWPVIGGFVGKYIVGLFSFITSPPALSRVLRAKSKVCPNHEFTRRYHRNWGAHLRRSWPQGPLGRHSPRKIGD